MRYCKKIPDHVRGLFERAIVLPLPPYWAEVLVNILTTGAMPPRDEYCGYSMYIGTKVSLVAYRVHLLLYVARRYKHPWKTVAVRRHVEYLAQVILIEENESQNP
jgi:hypothetical protein